MSETIKTIEHLKARLNEICSLERGWDGYRGMPVSFATALNCYEHLLRLHYRYDPLTPPYNIVPGPDGSSQIEWHIGGIDMEIDIDHNISSAWVYVEGREINLGTSLRDMGTYINRMINNPNRRDK